MAQIENIDDVLSRSRSLYSFIGLCDPEHKTHYDNTLLETWNRMSLTEQRKLYLYLLYRKWRGIDIYGEPYYIIMNCHPVPFNWNMSSKAADLIKENKVVIAKYQGVYGTYTKDEARLYEMTDIKPYRGLCTTL